MPGISLALALSTYSQLAIIIDSIPRIGMECLCSRHSNQICYVFIYYMPKVLQDIIASLTSMTNNTLLFLLQCHLKNLLINFTDPPPLLSSLQFWHKNVDYTLTNNYLTKLQAKLNLYEYWLIGKIVYLILAAV